MKQMRRYFFAAAVAVCCLLICGTALAGNSSGSCGGNLTYSFTASTGTLRINGSGDMTSYGMNDNQAPWYGNREAITSVVIGDSVTSIGDCAFYNCTALTSVTIGSSVSSIGNNSFSNCTSLTEIAIPDSIVILGGSSFANTGLTSVIIPNSVDMIGTGEFNSCSGLVSVTIPVSVTSISAYAFSDCTALTDVYYLGTEEQWSTITIGSHNESLRAAEIHFTDPGGSCGDDLTWTLNPASGMLTISGTGAMADYLKTGSDYAPWYDYREQITSVEIGDSVTGIGNYAFLNCTSLADITIPDSVTGMGTGAFQGCSGLTEVVIPNNVSSMGSHMFANCTGLESVIFPAGFSRIGDHMFQGCTGLTRVTIPQSVVSIGEYAFRDCTGMTSVNIPYNATALGKGAFYGCTGLTSVYIPSNVRSIGDSVFCGCTGLQSVSIPDVESIGNSMFDGCASLKSFVIPDTAESIGERAFAGCSSLTSITIPESVTSLGPIAFCDCTGLTSVTIPSSLESIASAQFYGCTGLRSLTIATSVTSIGDYAFYGCTALSDVYYPGSEEQWNTIAIGNNNEPLSGATIHAGMYGGACGENATWTLNPSNGRLTISGSGNMANYSSDEYAPWRNCPATITSVEIGDSITGIGNYAFNHCTSLTSVTIPGNVTRIGEDAFSNCGLTSVVIGDEVTEIGNSAFFRCLRLSTVVIPDKVTTIGGSAFAQCTGITDLTIGNSVTYIGISAFNGCTGLTDVTIPDSVRNILQSAFSGCTNLTSVTIPDSVTAIRESTFSQCTGLTGVTIPESVTSIEKNAFAGCTALANVYYPGTEAQWDEITIGNNEYLTGATIHCTVIDEAVAPTCTETGLTDGSHCSACDDVYVAQQVIPATGHAWGVPTYEWASDNSSVTATRVCANDETHTETETKAAAQETTKAATCEETGVAICSATFENPAFTTQTKEITLPSLNHAWGEPTYEWATDCSTVTATRKCANDETHVQTETVETTSAITKEATCGSKGETTYTATFTNAAFTTQVKTIADIPETEHTWGEPTYEWAADNSTVTATRVCANNATHRETETVDTTSQITKEATCGSRGETTYTATFTNIAFTTQTQTVADIPEAEHAWGEPEYEWAADYSTVTATRVCANNATHRETETVDTTSQITKEATCGSKGETTYTATFTNTAFTTQAKTVADIPEAEHAWGEPEYEWAADYSTVAATRVCANNATHRETETVETIPEITKEATCGSKGETTYTATFTNIAFTTQTQTVADIPEAEHAWGEPEYEWAADNSTVTATRVCANNATHRETETVDTTSQITKEATCGSRGETTYTATFTNTAFTTQAKTVADIPEAEHAWGKPTYEWSGDYSEVTATRKCAYNAKHAETETVKTVRELVTPPSDEEAGTYRIVSNAFENKTFKAQTKNGMTIPALTELNVLTIPSSVLKIESEAFAGTAAEAIVIPEGCGLIEAGAFTNCPNLRYVRIPTGTVVSEGAFSGCPKVVIDQR